MATATVATKPSLTIKRRLKAPPAQVFAAWINPEKIMQWFGPGPAQCTHAAFEPHVGGRYELVAQAPDGDKFQVGGVVREIIPNQKLVYTWAWLSMPERESLVTVELEPDGTGTLLTLTHSQFDDEHMRDRHQYGWNGALDKMEKMFA